MLAKSVIYKIFNEEELTKFKQSLLKKEHLFLNRIARLKVISESQLIKILEADLTFKELICFLTEIYVRIELSEKVPPQSFDGNFVHIEKILSSKIHFSHKNIDRTLNKYLSKQDFQLDKWHYYIKLKLHDVVYLTPYMSFNFAYGMGVKITKGDHICSSYLKRKSFQKKKNVIW